MAAQAALFPSQPLFLLGFTHSNYGYYPFENQGQQATGNRYYLFSDHASEGINTSKGYIQAREKSLNLLFCSFFKKYVDYFNKQGISIPCLLKSSILKSGKRGIPSFAHPLSP